MRITVNNRPRELAEGATVADLLADIPAEGTATALNGRFIPREARPDTLLREGDEVTVISAAYGG